MGDEESSLGCVYPSEAYLQRSHSLKTIMRVTKEDFCLWSLKVSASMSVCLYKSPNSTPVDSIY